MPEPLAVRIAKLSAVVLSAWLSDEKFQRAWRPSPGLFLAQAHSELADVCATLGPGADLDIVTIELQKRKKLELFEGGAEGLAEFILGAPAVRDPWKALEELQRLCALRALRDSLQNALRGIEAGNGLSETQSQISEALSASAAAVGGRARTVRDVMGAGLSGSLKKDRKPGAMTGCQNLDMATGGVRSRYVWVFGAETNWGKTSWLCAMASRALKAGRRPLIVSGEDPEELYGQRLLQLRARVNAWRLREGKLTAEEFHDAMDAVKSAESSPFFLDACGKPAEDIASHIRSHVASDGIDLVLVDYLQAFRSRTKHQDRRNEVAFTARVLTDAIKQSGAGGILFSQITKDAKGGTPTKDSIRESRDVSHAAEVVVLGYTEVVNDEERKYLFLDKCKDGPKGFRSEVQWDSKRACFIDDGAEWDDFCDGRYP